MDTILLALCEQVTGNYFIMTNDDDLIKIQIKLPDGFEDIFVEV